MQKFVDVLARWWLYHWTIDHTDRIYELAGVDLFILLSYGSKEECLTTASREITIRGAGISNNYFADASLVITTCAYTYPLWEHAYKLDILHKYGMPTIDEQTIWVENIHHTFDEAWKIYQAVFKRKGDFDGIIVVITGKTHSRTAWLMYRALFPRATILISAIMAESEYQPDHPMVAQQTRARWFRTALLRHMVARILFMKLPIIGFPFLRIGLRLLQNVHHKLAQDTTTTT
ncbi:MAG: hypothetical protein HY007_03315 [Candidatus Sungbacteria bacterium]|nr:hypothetical protein [Candidatus Sungbacteria bacterium]